MPTKANFDAIDANGNGDGIMTARMNDIAKRNLKRIPTRLSDVESESLSDKSGGTITNESVKPISAY